MPCYNPMCEIQPTKEVEALLCAMFKILGEDKALAMLCNPIALEIHGIPYVYVKSWWDRHKSEDAKKNGEEK